MEIKCFDDWERYTGNDAGSGRSEKIWLQSKNGVIGLFKFPKITDPITNQNTYEHISEHLASKIAAIVGVKTAKIDIGFRDGRIGSMSYLINSEAEALIEGDQYIIGTYPDYNPETLIDNETGYYYSIDHIFNAAPDYTPAWIEMMVFDFLIGNTDRHQNNWAIIRNERNGETHPSPLYDNGSSLCCYVKNDELIDLLRDNKRFLALVRTKSRSIIRIDGSQKVKPLHEDVVKYLLEIHKEETEQVVDRFLAKLKENDIEQLLNDYPNEILPKNRKKIICRFIEEKTELLAEIRKGS